METFYTPVIIAVLLIPTVTLAYQCHEQTCMQGTCYSPTTCETTAGCSTMKMTDMEVYSCASTVNMCINMVIDSNGVLTSQECCTSDLCNNGTVRSLPQPQTENYCYSASCSSNSTCLDSLITHVQDNQMYAYCKATHLGCQTTLQYFDGNYLETVGCAIADCMTAKVEGITRLCCADNLCNSATTQTIDPNKEYCHVYLCSQSDGQQCTSLADAIQQGDTILCEKAPGMSCIYQALVGPGSALINAGCESAVLPCMSLPTTITYEDGQTVPATTQTHCCDGDRCNAGQAITADPNKDQCYNMVCTDARDGSSCMSQAIADGKAGFCDKGISGCSYTYVSPSNGGSMIVAACNKDGTTCTPMARYDDTQGMGKTACCNESSCNSHGITVPHPTKSQCYEMECKGTDCLKKAIAADVYNLCDQTGFGCEVQEATLTGIYSMGCAASTCTEGTQLNTKTSMCCDSDLCQPDVIGAASRTFLNMSLGLAVMFLYCVM